MDPILGEIRAVAFPYAPRGWAVCDGSLQQISRNPALYSLLGVTYGGDGRTTFGLPDLRGRAIVNAGQGQGLSNYPLGTKAGVETVTLDLTQTPMHTHGFGGSVNVSTAGGNSKTAAGNFLANSTQNQYAEEAGTGTMAAGSVTATVGQAGSGQAHDNRQPYLALYYIIALVGEFPQRP